MLSTAYMAHYNAPKFYWDLKDRNEERYNAVVWKSFAASMTLMIIITVAGFATFGGASNSLILNNYAASDTLMSFSRAAVALSLIFSYPLAFVGVRANVLDLANVPEDKRSPMLSDILTVALLAGITGLAYVLTDIRVILSLGGATWGNLLVYVFPAIMMIGAAATNSDLKPKVPMAMFTGILGLAMGVVGTAKAVQSI
jgi:amino acid permease